MISLNFVSSFTFNDSVTILFVTIQLHLVIQFNSAVSTAENTQQGMTSPELWSERLHSIQRTHTLLRFLNYLTTRFQLHGLYSTNTVNGKRLKWRGRKVVHRDCNLLSARYEPQGRWSLTPSPVAPTSHMPSSCTSVWTPEKAPGWKAICNRRRRETSCHRLAIDTWHGFRLHRNSLRATVGQIKVTGHQTEIWCVPSAIHVARRINFAHLE